MALPATYGRFTVLIFEERDIRQNARGYKCAGSGLTHRQYGSSPDTAGAQTFQGLISLMQMK